MLHRWHNFVLLSILSILLTACGASPTDSEIQATQMAQAAALRDLLLNVDGIDHVYHINLTNPPYENYEKPVFVFAYLGSESPVDEATLPEQIKTTIADYFDETFDSINMDVHIVFEDMETTIKGDYFYIDNDGVQLRQEGAFTVTSSGVSSTTLGLLTETPVPAFPTLTSQ